MIRNGKTAPYSQKTRDLVVKLYPTHESEAIVEIVQGKKGLPDSDRDRISAGTVERMWRAHRAENGNGKAEVPAKAAPRKKRRDKFACKLVLPGDVVMELQPGQALHYHVSGKEFSIKNV